MEHLRSQVDDGDNPSFTENEIRLVRFIREGDVDWDALLRNERTPSDS